MRMKWPGFSDSSSGQRRPTGLTAEISTSNCANCHRDDLRGTPPEFPSLVRIGNRYTEWETATIIRRGSGRMPGFPHLTNESVVAMARFLTYGDDTKIEVA